MVDVDSSAFSLDATGLLQQAASEDGIITKIRTFGGTFIGTTSKQFVENGSDNRQVARWEHALNQLIHAGMVQQTDSKGEVFGVTHFGYQIIERIESCQSEPDVLRERGPLGFRTPPQDGESD